MMNRSYPEPIRQVRPHWLFFIAIMLIATVLFATLPSRPKILEVLNNLAHAPVFGALALIIRQLKPCHRSPRTRTMEYGIVFLLVVGIGVLVEIIQYFIGRDAELGDVGTDTLGAGCALGIAAAFDRQWRPAHPPSRIAAATFGLFCGFWALLPLSQAVVAYIDRLAAFPVIARFSSWRDLYFISSPTAHLSLQPLPEPWAQPGDHLSVRVDFTGGTWPGVSHDEPQPDWRGFSTLVVDVTNPAEAPLPLQVRVHDATHDQRREDRFNREFIISPATREHLRIALAEIAAGPTKRTLDMRRIAGIVVFASLKAAPNGCFYLNQIWLE